MNSKVTHESVRGTQTIERAAALLRLIGANNRTGMRLVELYTAAGLERPTAHRLLQGLIAERLVRQDSKSKHYYLGSLMYEMGLAAAPKTDLRDLCHPHLLSIADRSGDTVFLTVRSSFDGVCVDRAEGAYPIKVFVLDVGRRRPLNIGAGSVAILSALPDEEIDRICKVNAEVLRERFPRYSEPLMRDRIARARETGYVLQDVLEVENVRSIAVPIRGAHGRPVGAISVSTLYSRLEGARLEAVASYLFEAIGALQSGIEGY